MARGIKGAVFAAGAIAWCAFAWADFQIRIPSRLAGGAMAQACVQGSMAFDFTGADQSFTMPAGCTSVTAKLWGAGGGAGGTGRHPDSLNGFGGGGGFASGAFTLPPGQILIVRVGGGGGGAPYYYKGGGGGGYSGIFLQSGDPLLIAGGGGGGSGVTQLNIANHGGPGGGLAGGDAYGGSYAQLNGKGGTQSAGGGGGVKLAFDPNWPPADGGPYQGGVQDGPLNDAMPTYAGGTSPSSFGTSYTSGMGQGGGGYFGGGAGNVGDTSTGSGGGGGGSGYAAPFVFNAQLLAGSGASAANAGDPDRGGAGQGGTSPMQSGAPGRVVITWQ